MAKTDLTKGLLSRFDRLQGPVIVEQTKEEREAKTAKTYLGNVKVVWTNGNNVDTAPRDNMQAPPAPAAVDDGDLPF